MSSNNPNTFKQNAPNQNVNNPFALFGYDVSSPPPYRPQLDVVPSYYSQFQMPHNSIFNLNLKPNHLKPNFHPNRHSHLQPNYFLIPNTKNSNDNHNNKRKGRLIQEDGRKKKKLS
ncbi:unnamed protein product [Lactuca saligna]|uniref:Uncharacterized protein n=1 Tax=Lactuca saligna TaxID=75948 RepID=A0AA36EM43_LACSI|nr:unnamed protein product [Lactuca saligna]